MSEPPTRVYVRCPVEDEETLHDVLKGEVGDRGDYTLDAVVECRECGQTHQVTVREPGEVDVRVVVSEGDEAWTDRVSLPRDEPVAVDEKLVVDGVPVLVTAVERPDGTRADEAEAGDVETIWTKEHATVTIPFSVHGEDSTRAMEMETHPRDEYVVGDDLDLAGRRLRIHAVRTGETTLRDRGASAPAEDVERVYAVQADREK